MMDFRQASAFVTVRIKTNYIWAAYVEYISKMFIFYLL